MERVSRTCSCNKCGSVNLKVIPEVGSVHYECVECGHDILKVNCGTYKTLIPICKKCSSEVYKVWIDVDKESGVQTCSATCAKCSEKIERVLVDLEGNVISEDYREKLILKDKIEELDKHIEELEEQICEKEDTISNLEAKCEEYEVNYEYSSFENRKLEDDLRDSNNKIEELKRTIWNLENEIEELRRSGY